MCNNVVIQVNLINGTRTWQTNTNKLHRVDGPAVIHLDGSKEWWINDIEYHNLTEWTEVVQSEYKVTNEMIIRIILEY